MFQQYVPFVIQVGEQSADGYPETAEFQGAARSATIPAELPLLTPQEIEQALRWLERGFIDRDYAKDLGARLFATLFSGPIYTLFREASANAQQQNRGIRIVLELPPALATLPWELMYAGEDGHGFLARSDTAPLVRHFTDIPIPHSLPKNSPLRILVLIASPRGYAPVSGTEELEQLTKSLARRRLSAADLTWLMAERLLRARSLPEFVQSLRRRSLVEIDVLANATRTEVQQKLLEARNSDRNFHIIHFIGHGASDGGGRLLLESSAPDPVDWITAEDFAELIDQPTVNLVVLNACQSAATLDLFNGVAQAILRRGIPAVVGMQVQVLDRTAVEFAREFYGAWAAGEPVESALAYARRLLGRGKRGAAIDWGIPILYMGPIESLRLSLEKPEVPPALRWLQRVAALLLFLVVTAIPTAIFYRGLLPPEPERMTKLFNVAVADFGQVEGATAPARQSEDGELLSELAFDKLKTRFDQIADLAGDVGLQHAYIGIVPGDTTAARQLAAAELAQKLNADVVVYGNIDTSQLPAHFTPEFYISPRLTGAEESTGPGAFGAPVNVLLPLANSPDNRSRLAGEFIPRMEALTEFMFGLAFFKADLPTEALNQLELARQVKQWPDTPGNGKEVLYLWIGSSLLKRALQGDGIEGPPCPTIAPEASDDWACAQAAYERALGLNPRFARAHIGLGKVWEDQAKRIRLGREIIDCQAYLYAVDEHRKALAPDMEAAETAFVHLKAYLNIGLDYANSYRNGCGDQFYTPALEYLQLAAAEYAKNATVPLVRELGARTFYQLGLVYQSAGKYADALSALTQVTVIAEPDKDGYEDPWQAIRWAAQLQRGVTFARLAEAGNATQWQEALAAYRKVTDRYQEGKYFEAAVISDAYYGTGAAYIAMGQPLQALEPLTTSIRLAEAVEPAQLPALNPLPWTAYAALGDAYSALARDDTTRWAAALAAYNRVIQPFETGDFIVDGASAVAAYYGAGQVYEAQGQREQAVDCYQKALSIPALDSQMGQRIEARLQTLQ